MSVDMHGSVLILDHKAEKAYSEASTCVPPRGSKEERHLAPPADHASVGHLLLEMTSYGEALVDGVTPFTFSFPDEYSRAVSRLLLGF